MDNTYNRDEAIKRMATMKEKSISGSKGKRTNDKITIPRKNFKRLIAAVAAVSIAGTITFSGVSNFVFEKASESSYLGALSDDFKTEYIVDETHRTEDKENYYYDYEDIAEHLTEYGDFDEAVYLLNSNVGDYQTGMVLQHTEFGSFTNYKEARGYESTEDFRDDMKEKILIDREISKSKSEIETKNDELRKMNDEHPFTETQVDESTIGGK